MACCVAACALLTWSSAPAQGKVSSGAPGAKGSVAVIVNAGYEGQMSSDEIKRLYMGAAKRLPDGSLAAVYDIESCEARKRFCETILGITESQLKRYWMKMIVTGRAVPPAKLSPEEAVRRVGEEEGAVALVPLDLASRSSEVKIVLRLD